MQIMLMNDNDDSTPTNAHTHRQTDKQTDERKKEGKKGGFHFSSHLISQGQKIPVSARMSNLFFICIFTSWADGLHILSELSGRVVLSSRNCRSQFNNCGGGSAVVAAAAGHNSWAALQAATLATITTAAAKSAVAAGRQCVSVS